MTPAVSGLWGGVQGALSLDDSAPNTQTRPPLTLPALQRSSSITSSHAVSHVCSLNEKQLVWGVSLHAWPCVRVRPCDEMATALIVWHGAVAAFCQKSSSDLPTGMMAHLTNASPTKRANNADPTGRRKAARGRGAGRGGPPRSDTSGSLEHPDCVLYSRSSILCNCVTTSEG